jgi:branched-chain amino acid transport system substrate-binding protein
VLREIRAMYRKAGKEPPTAMASTVYYNRGVLQAALAVQAIRNALQSTSKAAITGEDVRKGFERIKDFTLGGLVPPIAITPENHEGGGWVQIWQVKGGKLTRVTDWFKAYPDVIAHHLKEAHAS